MTRDAAAALDACLPWRPPPLPEVVPTGDMPGDEVRIGPEHVQKAGVLFPLLAAELAPVVRANPAGRAVVAVAGGSGVGKSEIASLLAWYLRGVGVGTYTLSGDNYPRRIPRHNDAERLRIFRQAGLRALVADGAHTAEHARTLRRLAAAGADADPARAADDPWLAVYQRAGRAALRTYLGSAAEIDFDELSGIIGRFRSGAEALWLRRLGRTDADLWYDLVDLSAVSVLVVEWTHGLSDHLDGVDVPVLLHSTPAETLDHRRARNRDGATDSPFTTTVLEIEQDLLTVQARNAAIILAKSGARLTYEQFRAAAREGRAHD